MNLMEIYRTFKTDSDCLDAIEKKRWPDGIRCVICGGDKISRITRKGGTKNKRNRLYQCLEQTCKQQFSTTSGTVFHDSHLPLNVWFAAISLVQNAKKGISARQLQRDLGLGSYKTAWYLCHRIREAGKIANPTKLNGVVEIDECYIGPRQYKFKKKVSERKAPVVGIRQRGGEVRFEQVPDTTKGTLYDAIDKHVANDVEMICTDEYGSYNFELTQYEGKHFSVNHKRGEWKRGTVHTNTIESAFSLLKRGIVGNFHKVSTKHLHRYLAEFEYRFNGRKDPLLFDRTVSGLAKSSPLPFKRLVNG